MNGSAPSLSQWLLWREHGIGKPTLIVKFKFTLWPSDPCHNRDGVDGSAKTMFRLPERLFPHAQSLVEIPQLPRRFIEDSAEACEFVLPDHAALILKFPSPQPFGPFYQPPPRLP